MRKDPSYYRRLPYTREVEIRNAEVSGQVYFLARVSEIPWIEIHGDSREEALLKLDEIFDDCILTMLEGGDQVPEPEPWPERYSRSPDPRLPFDLSGFQRPDRVRPRALPEEVRPFTVVENDELATTGA